MTTNTIILLNIHKICRICLTENNHMKSLFANLDEDDELRAFDLSDISQALSLLTDVSFLSDDGFPNLICPQCTSLVCSAYKFKVQFDRSYSILRSCLVDDKSTVRNFISNVEDVDSKETIKFDFTDDFLNSLVQSEESQTYMVQAELSHDVPHTSNTPSNDGRKTRTRRKLNPAKEKEDDDEEDEDDDDEDGGKLNTKGLVPCPICMTEFEPLRLRVHVKEHKAFKKYLNVPEDFLVTTSRPRFYKTIDIHKPINGFFESELLHRCVYCNKTFDAESLRSHVTRHNNYKCDHCKRIFRRLNHLNTHRIKHLKEFPFNCKQCGKGFVSEQTHNFHEFSHKNDVLPYECKHCLKRFYNPKHLNRHLVTHTENISYSIKYKVRRCNKCLKSFKNNAELKSHACVPVRKIGPGKRFSCKLCDKIFRSSTALKTHGRRMHDQDTKKLCSVCGLYVDNIYSHMMRHSGEKPFQCNQCGKRFLTKPQLKQHLLVHSGDKPYMCSICAKTFNNLYNLQVHERIHKGERTHICGVCDKAFLEKSYLKKHMNIHSRL